MVFLYYIMYISVIVTYCDVPSNVNLRSVFPWLRVPAVFMTNENALIDIVTSNSDGCYHYYGYVAVSKIPDHY
jgi:hypothetical protein